MGDAISFSAVIEATGSGGAYVLVPFDSKKVFGKAGMVKVKVTFDGEPYRGSIANMGEGPMLPILKAIRTKINKQAGDTVDVTVSEDTEARTIELPADALKAMKKHKGVLQAYESMSYTHRREYVTWIEGAKKEETRQRRIEKCITMLQEKAEHKTKANK